MNDLKIPEMFCQYLVQNEVCNVKLLGSNHDNTNHKNTKSHNIISCCQGSKWYPQLTFTGISATNLLEWHWAIAEYCWVMKSVRLRCIATTDTSTTRTKSYKHLVPLALLDSLLLSMLPRRMAVVNTSCKEIYATQQLHRPLPSLNRLGHPDWNYAAFQSEIGTRMKRGSMPHAKSMLNHGKHW